MFKLGQLNNLDWEHVDIAALIAGVKGDGVISGKCYVNGTEYPEVSGQNVNVGNGDATHPRKDIVTYDTSAGNPAVVAGTPAAAPIPPDIPSGDIYLAMVHVAANESTSIVNADIDEGRVYVNTIPSGLISMWHGTLANIPTGWLLCDGTSGTPDLREKFVRGSAASTNPGSTGGSDTHSLTYAEAHLTTTDSCFGCSGTGVAITPGSATPHNNIPAYYAIAYIMKE